MMTRKYETNRAYTYDQQMYSAVAEHQHYLHFAADVPISVGVKQTVRRVIHEYIITYHAYTITDRDDVTIRSDYYVDVLGVYTRVDIHTVTKRRDTIIDRAKHTITLGISVPQ